MQPRHIGLAGLGFLGQGIAQCLLNHGFHVIALDPRPISFNSPLFTLAATPKQLAHCEFIIETISEDFAAKQTLFDELEPHLPAHVPITSNTSAIPISLLQANRQHPNRFAGMHWNAPADVTRFMEIIRGDQTDDSIIHQVAALARELGKHPAIVHKDIPGFVANRLAYAMYREALHLLEAGIADVESIDLLCQHSLGLWTSLCGPFRWIDITGGPTLYAKAMETIMPTLSNEGAVPTIMQRLRETNQHFYTYAPDEDAEWQKKLHTHALKISELDQ